MRVKNVLFINPYILKQTQMGEEILVGQLYIENYIKSKIPDLKTDIIDFICEEKLNNFDPNQVNLEEKFYGRIDKMISSIDFDLNENSLIGITCPTSFHYIPFSKIFKYFSKVYPNVPIAVGGAHVSSVPNDFILSDPIVDYVIIGEGELTLYEIIKNDVKKKKKTPQIFKNNPIESLDDLPIINFDLYDKYLKLYDTLSISLSRGCPFSCSFCIEKKLVEAGKIQTTWRSYSPTRAITEFKSMLKCGELKDITSYGFYDPIFGFSRKWLNDFLELFPKNPDFHVWTECRLDVLNENVLTKLHERNISLMYGLESYSKEMLTIMNKTQNPTQYLKKFDEIISISKKLEMFCVLNILINHPGETEDSFNETLEFSKKIADNADIANLNFNFYRNIPGTPLYSNMGYYKENYGSEFYISDWWKSEEFMTFGHTAIRPRRDFSLRDILKLYFDGYTVVVEKSLESLKRFKSKINDYFVKVIYEKGRLKTIKLYYEKFNEFLDEKGIETDY